MSDIIKTWPAHMPREKVRRLFALRDTLFYFVVSRGKPAQPIEHLWYTHQGELLGRFVVRDIVCNVGQLPKLRSLENRASEWQIKRDRWVAICPGPFIPLEGETIYHDSFRGFRYFNVDVYRETPDARIAI